MEPEISLLSSQGVMC